MTRIEPHGNHTAHRKAHPMHAVDAQALKQRVSIVAQMIQIIGFRAARAFRLALAAPVDGNHAIALPRKMIDLMLKALPGIHQTVPKEDHLIARASILIVIETSVD